MKRIILLGAYGFTAKKIALLLDRAGITFIAAGRDEQQLSEMRKNIAGISAILKVDIGVEEEMDGLVGACDILINCIGPYNIYADKIVQKCVDAGICYLDITGEQHIVKTSFDRYKEVASQNGACIVHSLAFESALTDLMADVFLPKKRGWKDISTVYFFERSVPSPGTRLSMETSRFYPVYHVESGQLLRAEIVGFSKDVDHSERPGYDRAVFMPYPESIFFRNKFSPEDACTYLLTTRIEAKYMAAAKGNSLSQENIIERARKRRRKGPSDEDCEQQHFEVILFAREESGRKHCYQAVGKNMYQLTASIMVTVLSKLLENEVLPAGVFAPSDLVDNTDSLLREICENNSIQINREFGFHIREQTDEQDKVGSGDISSNDSTMP